MAARCGTAAEGGTADTFQGMGSSTRYPLESVSGTPYWRSLLTAIADELYIHNKL